MAQFQQVQTPSNLGEPTVRSLNINSTMNQDVFGIYGIDPNSEPTITTIEILNTELTELLIRFDNAPEYYQKEDYADMVSMLYNSLKYIYKPESNKAVEFKGIATISTNPTIETTLRYPGLYLASQSGTYTEFLNVSGVPINITSDDLIQSIIFLVPVVIDDVFAYYTIQRYRLNALLDETLEGDGTSSNKYRVVISQIADNMLHRSGDGLSVVLQHDQTLSGNADDVALTVRLSTEGDSFTKNILSKHIDGLHAEETDPYYNYDKPNIALKDGSNSAINVLSFITNPIVQPLLAGQFQYNPTEGTVLLGMNGGSVEQSIGLELYVRYKASEDIHNGELLMYDGTDGNSGTVKLKKATVNCDPKLIYAIATEDAQTGSLHFATWYGKLRGIDTSAFIGGVELYQSTTIAGALQSTQPTAPYNKASYAKVINSHSSQGTIFVKISRSLSLNDINDVDTTNSQTNQPLVMQSDGVWKGSDTIQVNEIIPRTDSVKISNLETSNASIAELHSLNIKADNYVESSHFIIPFKGDDEIITAGGGTKAISDFQLKSEKGQPNGYASLDAAGLVPTTQLPAYVDDVLEFDNLASFPAIGEAGKIYVAKDTNKTYRWSGSVYIYITSGAVDSVAGKTGVVTLVKGDVGLGNVDNTSDLNKPVSTATQIALNGKVNNTGNETIAGTKTFSSLPKVPLTPIANEDVASKAYADGQANAALTLAQKYAENPEDVEVVTGEYSAKHYSLKAAQSAQSINESADMLIRHEAEIASLENTLNSANINQETTATASGVDTVALPKTAANTGMQVQMFGQSAQNLVVNGDFRNGTTEWTAGNSTNSVTNGILTNTGNGSAIVPHTYANIGAKNIGNKYYVRANVTSKSSLCIRLFITTADNVQNVDNPVLNTSYTLSGVITASSTYNLIAIYHTYTTAADSNGAAIEVKNVMAINLTATFGAGNEPTKEQCDILFANYFEGSDNVLGTGRVRSVGKNLLDLSRFSSRFNGATAPPTSFTFSSETIVMNNSTDAGCGLSQKIKLRAGVYRFSVKSIVRDAGTAIVYLYFIDANNKNIFSESVENGSITVTEENSRIIDRVLLHRAGFLGTKNVTITGLQLERSAAATTYEPYRESILQLTTPPLRSNGTTKDEIRKGTNGYELVKRVGVGTLGASRITGGDFKTGLTSPNLSAVEGTWVWNSGTKDATFTSTGATSQLFLTVGVANGDVWVVEFYAKSSNETGVPVVGTPPSVVKSVIIEPQLSTSYQRYVYSYKFTAVDHVRVLYKTMSAGGEITIDDLSIRKLNEGSLAGSPILTFIDSNVHYTLATPVITPIAHAGLLNSNSNGTAYFEPIIADAGVYSTNLTVQLTDYPIASFESIRKYANGTYTELSTATAVVASGGLSFTHPDLVSGDLVMFTYAYANESIGHSMTLSYAISNSNPYYNVTNSVPLTSGYYTSTTARAAVPEGVRKTGLILTYETAAGVWYTERYIGTATDTTSFTTASNWEVGVLRIASVTDTTEYAEITI